MRDFDYYGFDNYNPAHDARVEQVEAAFNRDDLARICAMSETEFAEAYDMETIKVQQKAPDDFYYFRDNGSDILAVAHLDTVGLHHEREAHFVDTEAGPVIFSRALDDRLGAYIILELLPALGLKFDLLLTVGEESGKSTAAFFEPRTHHERQYNWMIEFDRGGTDVVLYQYDDAEHRALVRASGAKVGDGIFSDISYMEHLLIKGFNWGVGYVDYHGPRAHAFLADTFKMVAYFLKFHATNADVYMEHEEDRWSWESYRTRGGEWWDDDEFRQPRDNDEDPFAPFDKKGVKVEDDPSRERCDRIFGTGHMHDDDECAQILAEFADDPEVVEVVEVEVVEEDDEGPGLLRSMN